jgi:hypothetical protein
MVDMGPVAAKKEDFSGARPATTRHLEDSSTTELVRQLVAGHTTVAAKRGVPDMKRMCLTTMMGLALVSLSVVAVRYPAHAVQQESREEKEANLNQQAKGGLFHKWTFDQDEADQLPAGFAARSSGQGREATWTVRKDETAPSRPHVVAASSHCVAGCFQLLLAEGLNYEYPDLSVRFRGIDGMAAAGGMVLGVKDAANFYAVTVDMDEKTVQVVRMIEGKETVLAQSPIQLKPVDWHSLRVQRNTIISKDFIETYVDGTLMLSVEDQSLGLGQVGLLVHGNSSFYFDSFHAVPLFSHRPLSAPAAY